MASTRRLPVPLVSVWLLICAGCGSDVGPESVPHDDEANVDDQIRDHGRAEIKEEIQTALAAAQHDGKRVLLEFDADWCPDCRALQRMLTEEPLAAVLESGYHVVRIDVGRRDRNLDIVAQYDNPIAGGIPAIVILDGAGQVLVATNQGELATARAMGSDEVLAFLRRWAPGRSGRPNGE